jgi:tungstate transport system substrate-binding protein
MHNDFVLVGPREDPARIKGEKSVVAAFTKIAAAGAGFVSRGDASGTNAKELEIWSRAGVKPQARWYNDAGQGMGEVLVMANDLKAYTLSDRGTWLAMKGKLPSLVIVAEGDPALFNPYGVIAVNPQKHPDVNYMAAMQYIAWVTSVEGQRIIREYTVDGQALFTPDVIR